jgi:predicted DNA-binding protein (MmcQ/YjbR family)
MSIDELRELALSFPGVTEDVKWGHDLCFLVGRKMFLVLAPDRVPVSGSFKTTPELYDELCAREGFIPAPYMARNRWVQVEDIASLRPQEWHEHAARSYELVSSKLTKKVRSTLGLK